MKIYEITEAPDLDDVEPSSNVKPARAKDFRQQAQDKDWTQAELTQMRQTYKDNPEFVNLVQVALMMPHIQTMQQAISYANTELAALKTRDQDSVDRHIRKTGGKAGDWKSAAQAAADAERRATPLRKYSKIDFDQDFESPGIPGLNSIKSALSKIVQKGEQKLRQKGVEIVPGETEEFFSVIGQNAKDIANKFDA